MVHVIGERVQGLTPTGRDKHRDGEEAECTLLHFFCSRCWDAARARVPYSPISCVALTHEGHRCHRHNLGELNEQVGVGTLLGRVGRLMCVVGVRHPACHSG